jgi:hypothetical protein
MAEEIKSGSAVQETVLTGDDLSILAAGLGKVRSRLSDEVKKRKDMIKPIEQALSALKDPHKNAVALHEAATTLSKPHELDLPDDYTSLIGQLRALAEDKLSELEFTFARDLRAAFQEQGIKLEGSRSELVADLFLIKIDILKKQVQMTFSRQPVTAKTIKLEVDKVVSAYQRAKREICERNTDLDLLLKELFETYQRILKLSGKPAGTRVSIVDCYRELVLIRQPLSFRRTPSKVSFVDYPKTHFIFDMLQLRRNNRLTFEGQRLNFGTATIDVGTDSTRAMFLATGALEGAFIKDIYFAAEK